MLLKSKKEKILPNFNFKLHRFTKKIRSDKVLIITNFSELGVETLACNYSIPQILQIFNGYYVIIVGWSGREYFYRHLADEFWELDAKHYWIKDYCNAFKVDSENIKLLENELKKIGILIKSEYLGNFLIANVCKKCFHSSLEKFEICVCGNNRICPPLLTSVENKKFIRNIPRPRESYIEEVRKMVPKNSVAIFARNRKTYGRNLPKNFYENLNKSIVSKNLTPIYLGETSSSLNMEDCIDFSNTEMSKDLEFTLSVLSCVEFSIQLWTASTRLSSIVQTPFLLVESLDQIALRGLEGPRIAATTRYDKKKIIISNYLDFLDNLDLGLSSIEKAIDEIKENNWDYIFDLVKDKNLALAGLKGKNLLYW